MDTNIDKLFGNSSSSDDHKRTVMDTNLNKLFGNSSSTDRSAKRRKKAKALDDRRVEIIDFSQQSVSTLDGCRLTVDVTDNVLTLYFENTKTLAVYKRVIRESDLSVFDTPQLESVDFLSQILLDALQKRDPAIVSCTVERVKDKGADSIHIVVSNKYRYAPYQFTLRIPRKTLDENTENKLRLEKVLVENETLRQRLEEMSKDVQYMRFLERERQGIGLHALMGQTCNGEPRKEVKGTAFHNTGNPRTIQYDNKLNNTILKSYHVVCFPFSNRIYEKKNVHPIHSDEKTRRIQLIQHQRYIRYHNGSREREVCVEVTLKVPALVYTSHPSIPRKLNNTKWVMRWSKDTKQWLLDDKYVNQFTEEFRPHPNPSDSNYHIIKRRATFVYWSAATLPSEWRAQGVHHEYKVLANEDDEET